MSDRRRVMIGEIRGQLDAFEEHYGVPSDRMLEAFDAHERCGNTELDRWAKLDHAWMQGSPDE